jgi:hypothetical protein
VSRYTILSNSAFKRGSDREPDHTFLCHHFFFNFSTPFASALALASCMLQSPPPLTMAASHLHLFQPSVSDENEIRKLIVNHFLPDRVVLQWRPATGEDISTPDTNEFAVFASFFQCGFSLLVCDFLRGLLDHYQIVLVHVNPNFIL